MKSSTRLQANASDSSFFQSDTGMLSSPSTQDIFKLQKEILDQSKSIEEYIRTHQKSTLDANNESFSVLESLLSLFKLEVSMNVSLRKAVINERTIRTKLENEIKQNECFFQEFSRITNNGDNTINRIQCFEDVFNYVISANEKYLKSKNKMKSIIAQQQAQIQDLQQSLANRDEEIQRFSETEKECGDAIQKLKTKVVSFKTQINSLKAEVEQSNEIIRKQRLAIKQQKTTSESDQISAQKEIENIRIQCEQEISEYQERNHLQHQKCHSQQLKLKELDSKLRQKDDLYQNKENEYHRQISDLMEQVQSLQLDNQNCNSRLESENKKLLYIQSQNAELESKLLEVTKSIENYKTQVFNSNQKVVEMKASLASSQKKFAMKLQSQKMEQKHKMAQMANSLEISLENKIKTYQAEVNEKEEEMTLLKEDIQKSNQQIQELVKKLRKQEKRLQMEQKNSEELKIENERLRNIMREKSDNAKESDFIINEFKKLQDILDIGPSSTAHDIVDAVVNIVSRERKLRRRHD